MPLAPRRVLRVFRYAMYFDGVDDYVNIPLTVYGWSAITVQQWIYAFHPKVNAYYSTFSNIGDSSDISFFFRTDNRYAYMRIYLYFYAKKPDGTLYNPPYGTNLLPYVMKMWGNVAFKFTPSKLLYLYVNYNQLLKSWDYSGTTTILEVDPNTMSNPSFYKRFVLGASSAYGSFMTMMQSQLLIYTRALSDSEIAWNYSYPDNPVRNGLYVWLQADPAYIKDIDGDGILEWLDLSGFGNHGKIYGACLPRDTLIYTPNGTIPISELSVGDSVYAFTGGGIGTRPVVAKVRTGVKKVFRLRTRNRLIETTDNHMFLRAVWEGYMKVSGYRNNHPYCYRKGIWVLEWVELKDLREGDIIVSLHHVPEVGCNPIVSEDFMRFVGCFLGDGYVSIHKSSRGSLYKVGLCLVKPEQKSKYSEILKSMGVKHRVREKEIVIYSKEFAEFLRELDLAHDVHSKHIPKWVWKLPRTHIKALIEGLIDSDGWVIKQTPNQVTFQIELANEKLVKEVRALCHYIGLRTSNIYHRKKKEHKIGNRTIPTTELWGFQIYPSRGKSREPRFVVYGVHRRVNLLLPEEFEFQQVTEIEPIGEKEVYDITVPDAHNFIAEGLVVHNSLVELIKPPTRVLNPARVLVPVR